MSKKILLINDMVGYGKVALSAAMPVLTYKGYELFILPSTLISNTLNYGKYAMLDTTQYMKETVSVWEELGFEFDAVSVGFISGEEQAEWIAGFCEKQKKKGAVIFVDPIMGDNGKLYNSVTPGKVECIKRLVKTADYIVPNYTEACYLAGIEYVENGISGAQLMQLLERLRAVCPRSVVITSIPVKNVDGTVGKCVGVYDDDEDEYFSYAYREIPVRINGSGDTFLAILMSRILEHSLLKYCIADAVEGVSALITRNIKFAEYYNGLPIEKALDVLL